MKRVMDLFECGAILHNILLDYDDDLPAEWMVELEEGHYWTNDFTGEGDTHENGNENYDRREQVFTSLIEDLY